MRIVGNDPELSRQIMATASGAISAAGKPLVVNTDGTVSVISNSPDVLGDQTSAIYSGDFQMAAAVYDEGQDKVLFVYSGASNYGYAVVGTVSGSSISFGTPAAFISSAASYVAATYDPDNAKTAIFWNDGGDSNKQKAVVATISGTSVSFGTVATFSAVASSVPTKDSTYDTSENKFIVVFSKGTFPSARTMEALAATISGTDISFGSETEIGSSTTAEIGVAYDANADKSLVIYRDPSTNYVKSRVLSLSGTTVSAGTETTLYGAAGDKLGITYDSTAQKLVAFYRHDSGTTHTKFIVATISGTSVSYGTPVDTGIDFNGTPRNNSIHHNVAANKIVFIGRDGGNSYIIKYIIATVSGTSITIDNTVTIYDDSNDSYLSCNVYDPDQEKSVLFYADGTAGAFKNPVVRVLTVGAGENLTTENYIGTSAHSVADGAKVLVNTQGAVDDNQSGLTAGQTYYVDVNGALQLTTNITQGAGTVAMFEDDGQFESRVVFDPDSGKFIISYYDVGNSGKGTYVVATISGTDVTYGTPAVFADETTYYYGSAYDTNSDRVVVTYRGASDHGKAIVGTVSGTTISWGTAVTFNAAATPYTACCFDSANNKIVIAYRDEGNSNHGTAIVGTVDPSDNSISFGSEAVFEAASTLYIEAVFDTTNDRVIIAYDDGGNSNYGTAIVGQVSGTSISFGTAGVWRSDGNQPYKGMSFDSNSGNALIAYRGPNSPDNGRAIVAQVGGSNSIGFGTAVDFDSSASTHISAAFDSNVNKHLIVYKDVNNSNKFTGIVATVSGTSISVGSSFLLAGDNVPSETSVAFDTTNNKFLAVFGDDTTGGGGSPDGKAVAVTLANDLSGSLSHNVVTAGTALSATKLLVKG